MKTIIEQKPTERKLRVLVVDNDPVDRIDHIKDLMDWGGYEPIVAEGKGKALIEDAKRKAQEHRCHAALVDMRLYDDHDDSDRSGLELVQHIKFAKCVVVTGYGSLPTSRKASEYGAVMVGKEEGSDAVRIELENALQDLRRSDFVIEPSGFLEQHVVPYLRSDERQPVQADEARDVLMMLFPQVRSIHLQLLSGGVPSTPTSAGSGLQGSSVVVRVRPNKQAYCIVKFASPKAIKRERESYTAYVENRMENLRRPQLIGDTCFWNVGTIAYSFLGGNVNDIVQFRAYYHNHTTQEITAALRDLFLNVWHPLYKDQDDLLDPLYTAYDRLWSRPGGEGYLAARVDDWKKLDKSRSFESLSGEFPEPRRWLADHWADSRLLDVRSCVVHGDLHGGNFFVDRHGNTWVIDFERTGRGHILADFVELEHDLLRELASDLDLPTLFQLLKGLVTPLSISRTSKDNPLHLATVISALVESVDESLRARIEKGLQTIYELRKIAVELFNYDSQLEYYWALLLDTLFGVQRLERQPSLNAVDKTIWQRELLIASVMCQRLKVGESTWPPSGWQQTNSLHTRAASPAKASLLSIEPNMHDFDVFLCHNSQDKLEVKEIGQLLKKRGIQPWLDEWELQPGLPWQDALEDQIPNIRSAAVFVGSNGTGPWQAMEIAAFLREFVKRKCPVIPILLGSASTAPHLPTFLRGMTWVDFRKREPDPLDQLIFGITGKKPV